MSRQISEEEHRRRSEAHKGKPLSEAHKQAIREGHKNSSRKAEVSQARSEQMKGHVVSETTRQKIRSSLQGRRQSEESKQKKREAQKRVDTPEYREKLSKGVRRAYENPEYAEKVRQAQDKAQKISADMRRGVSLSPEHREKAIQGLRKGNAEYWASKTYEERLELTREKREASRNSKVSSLETQVARLFNLLGIQYEQQKPFGDYAVDFFLPDFGVVVECYGCYWHACNVCGPPHAKQNFYAKGREAYIRAHGYEYIVLWEHDLKVGNYSAMNTVLEQEERRE